MLTQTTLGITMW